MNSLFSRCSSLKELLDISKWDTSKVINMSKMFNHCIELKELPEISNWDTNNVINREKNAFFNS